MSEVDQLREMFAEQRREARERRLAKEHEDRVRYRDNVMTGRATVDCECDYCLTEILAVRTPDRSECQRLKEQARKAKQQVTHEVVEPPFELKG